MEILLVIWDDRYGYIIEPILSAKKSVTLPNELLELVFFKALGIPERRIEPKFWIQDYKKRKYACYFPGAWIKTPVVLIGKGNVKLIRLVMIDIAIKLRKIGFEKRSDIFNRHYISILLNLKKETTLLFALSNETCMVIYKILLNNPIVTIEELMDLTLFETPILSMQDIKESLLILNSTGIVDVKWIGGEETIYLTKVIVPVRRYNRSLLIANSSLMKEVRKIEESIDFVREIVACSTLLLCNQLRNLLYQLYKRGRMHIMETDPVNIDYLLKHKYAIQRGNMAVFFSFPVLKLYNLMGKKVREYSILTF